MNAALHAAGFAALVVFSLVLVVGVIAGARALVNRVFGALFGAHEAPTEPMTAGAEDSRAPETGDPQRASSTAPPGGGRYP